ncbi:MAG: hypothetical protein LUI39_10905 [Lachnospiraceae bacterium]|nr:hypothetical protein [Lachnospiraceae bacterium]
MDEQNNMIDLHYSVWLERVYKPTEKLKAVTPFLESISEEDDKRLFDYISEIQRDAYHAGFADGVQLMKDCSTEQQKRIPRQ